MIIIGMMSGTSTDGIDAVVTRLEGPASGERALRWELISHVNLPFAPALHKEILACVRADTGNVERVCALNFNLGETYAEAAQAAMRAANLGPEQVDLIANHGQTVWHIPNHSTLQIGSPAVIAERTGVTVISNFRARDIAAGGQGAPLVAFVDALLFTDPDKDRALQNIGGIANVTWLPAGEPEHSFAFDSGPGNVLIDDAVRRATDGRLAFDDQGRIAAAGQVDRALLEKLMADPYLAQRPPKTTGREVYGAPFGEALWREALASGIRADDLVATLTRFTADSIAAAYADLLPHLPDEVIVSGGGAKNPTLLAMLEQGLAARSNGAHTRVPVRRIDELGIPADAKEALAFAVLAYETWHGRPSNLPRATGAQHPVILGDITPGRNWR
jgi:anhydro-N-acetylmuramic acid kinase